MPSPPVSDDKRQRRREAVEAALAEGFSPFRQSGGKGSSVEEAARRMGDSGPTIANWIASEERFKANRKKHFLPDWSLYQEPESASVEMSRAEIHDADFWRRKHQAIARDMGEAEHLIEQLSGLRGIPFQIPDWIMDTRQGSRGKSVVGCLVSDIHMGEVVAAEELLGINAFDPDICRARLRRYFTAACTIGQRWASDTDCEGALLALAGDLISGDIHDELRMTNALTSHEQCIAAAEECSAGIIHLAETYGRVHVVVVPGNHGRTTIKPTAKLYARLSYDNLIGAMVAQKFAGDPRITFQMSAAKDQITPIFGRSVFTTHGDKMGTGGGQGFAGPMLPIVRGTKKVEAQQAGIGRRPDLIQHGHYHTTGNPGNGVLSNGSVPGYTEYGSDLRAAVEAPQQWLYLLHSRWWLRERAPIQLEEPKIMEKPRVTIPAGMRSAA